MEALITLFFTAVFLGVCVVFAMILGTVAWGLLIAITRLICAMIWPFVRLFEREIKARAK